MNTIYALKVPYPLNQYYIFYILFLAYAIWDWNRTKTIRDSSNTGTIFMGFRQATVAWIMKIFVTYTLCIFIVSYLLTLQHELRFIDNLSLDKRVLLEFFGQPVTAQLPSGELNDLFNGTHAANLMVSHGYVRIEGWTGVYIFIAKYVLRFLYVPAFLLLLRSIFHSLSIQKPFIIENVNRLRLLAAIVLSNHIVESLIEYWSDVYVKSKITFSTMDSFRMREVGYDPWFIFISILLLAEIIRYGAQLKEDRDLTV